MAGNDLLKIGQLARMTGVGRGTIQHYLREGLLPRPVKTHRNMAYYDSSCVDRIRTIKELQQKRRLPLAEIRKILGGGRSDTDAARALLDAQRAALEALTPPTETASLTAAAAARAFGVSASVIDDLHRAGLISFRREDGKELLSGPDLEVIAAVANLGKIGFRPDMGFRPRNLSIYRRAMEQLLRDEVKAFLRVAAKREASEKVPGLARSAVDAATMLMVAVRRKLITDLVSAPDTEFLGALERMAQERPAAASRRKRRPAKRRS